MNSQAVNTQIMIDFKTFLILFKDLIYSLNITNNLISIKVSSVERAK